MVGAGPEPGLSCSASRESLPTDAGRPGTGRSGTAPTGRPVPEVRSEPARSGVAAGDRPAVAAGTVTGPGSRVADDGMLILAATAAAVATITSTKTPHAVRIDPLSYLMARHGRHAVEWSRLGRRCRDGGTRQPASREPAQPAGPQWRSALVDSRRRPRPAQGWAQRLSRGLPETREQRRWVRPTSPMPCRSPCTSLPREMLTEVREAEDLEHARGYQDLEADFRAVAVSKLCKQGTALRSEPPLASRSTMMPTV